MCLCLLLFVLCVIASETAPQQKTTQFATRPLTLPTAAPPADTGQAFQQSDFYRTIVDNNLFRPLGWRETRLVESYRLIGTLVYPSDKGGRGVHTPACAILQSTIGNTTHIVSPGDTLDVHTKVVSIQHKTVVLETDGKQRTLRLHIRF